MSCAIADISSPKKYTCACNNFGLHINCGGGSGLCAFGAEGRGGGYQSHRTTQGGIHDEPPLPNVSTSSSPENAIWGPPKPLLQLENSKKKQGFLFKEQNEAKQKADPGNAGKFSLGIPNGHFGMI